MVKTLRNALIGLFLSVPVFAGKFQEAIPHIDSETFKVAGDIAVTTGSLPSSTTSIQLIGASGTIKAKTLNLLSTVDYSIVSSSGAYFQNGGVVASWFQGYLYGNAQTASTFELIPSPCGDGFISGGINIFGNCIPIPVETIPISGSTNPISAGAVQTGFYQVGLSTQNLAVNISTLTFAISSSFTDVGNSTQALAVNISTLTEAVNSSFTGVGYSTHSLDLAKVDRAGDTMIGTFTITAQDPDGFSMYTSSGIKSGGCFEFGDSSRQCSAVAGLSGHTISTATNGLVYDLPMRSKLIFDGNQFVAKDSSTLNGTLIQNPSVCQMVPREVPSGDIDGINDTFTLVREPKAGSEFVHVNGLQNNIGDDYTIIQGTVTFTAGSIPQTGWSVNVTYCYYTSEPDLNFSPPYQISGSQIQDSTITALQLANGLKAPIQSTAGAGFKKVTTIEYNPTTGEIRVTYEE